MKIVAKIIPALIPAFISTLIIALLVVPMLTFAQGAVPPLTTGTIGQTFTAIITFINSILVPFVFAVAFLVFIWGIFQTFILGGGDEEKQTKGKQLMLYAIVGFVLMVSIWGIVNLIAGGFGLRDTIPTNIPTVPVAR